MSLDGMPLKVEFQDVKARRRNLSVQTTESKVCVNTHSFTFLCWLTEQQKSFYRDRTRERDPYCLITKLRHKGDRNRFDRFEAAHIFPRAHQNEVC